MGWGGALARQIRIFWVALIVFLDYKWTQKWDPWTRESQRERLWESTHIRNSKRVLHVITKLKGLWVKAGQYLSTRADVLPEAYIICLRVLQDSLPPRRLSEVYGTVEKELGKPVADLFTNFVEIPIATASIAQVHRAYTKDGLDVVVKVQHAGIKDIILQDLKNARTIIKWIAWAEPQYDFGPVIDEWCAEVPKELDFNLEAESTRKVASNLDFENTHTSSSFKSQVDILVPHVIQSTEKVLVLEYMDGVRLNDVAALDSLGVDRQHLVETITRCYAHQIYIDGFFNADPHPGNFLVSRQPPFKPVLLDFGLTKSLNFATKQAFAKMLLACAEGDYSALLSAFSEMGLKLRLDIPEEAMEVTTFFFRRSMPAKEAVDSLQDWSKEREERLKRIQEKAQLEEKGKSIRNPVDAFPGDAVFFMRVLNLLRGLSASLNTQVVYLDVMKPFAEVALSSSIIQQGGGDQIERNSWVYETPSKSETEDKVRNLLLGLGRQQRILGIQVCVYKDGKVIIDTAAGVLGKFDPRPVQPDSLFPVFSTTKGVTAGLVHWLLDHGALTLGDKVADLWPEFGVNGKETCTVAHVLNHTAGLHNALSEVMKAEPLVICNFKDCVSRIAAAEPASPPGSQQAYHAMSFGWICGGIIERASKKSFQDFLEQTFTNPLGVTGEFYIGIPPGVESRLASLTLDSDELKRIMTQHQAAAAMNRVMGNGSSTLAGSEHEEEKQQPSAAAAPPSLFLQSRVGDTGGILSSAVTLFNALFIRRAVVPAANGHFSARALARYYAMLAAGGKIPETSSSSEPPLGSHPQVPSISPTSSKKRGQGSGKSSSRTSTPGDTTAVATEDSNQLFSSPKLGTKLFQAAAGTGEFSQHVVKGGQFGLGFIRLPSEASGDEEGVLPFGHSGMGGSTGFCDPAHNFAIAITLNKLNRGDVASEIVRLVCRELGIPCPLRFAEGAKRGVDMTLELEADAGTDSIV